MQKLTVQQLLILTVSDLSDVDTKRAMILKVMVYLLSSTFHSVDSVQWTEDHHVLIPDTFDVDEEFDKIVDNRLNALCQDIQSRATELDEYLALFDNHRVPLQSETNLDAMSVSIMESSLPQQHGDRSRYTLSHTHRRNSSR
jgi:hypothetical protein